MKRRTLTRPGFEPALPGIPDPICAHACGKCWACRRKKSGPEWYLEGPPYPRQRRRN